jgi:hypothetical protein
MSDYSEYGDSEVEFDGGEDDAGRDAWYENTRRAEDRLEQYRDERTCALRKFEVDTMELRAQKIISHGTLKQALEFADQEANKDSVVFARDKPSPNEASLCVKYKKEYLVGMLHRFYRFAILSKHSQISLDEVVRSNQPSPLHFDIEIKKVSLSDFGCRDVESVLRAHVLGLKIGGGSVSATNTIEDVSLDYINIAGADITEEECLAGLGVVTRHIMEMVHRLVPSYAAASTWRDDMLVLTGCRANKFSLHVIMKWVFCDSAVQAMPVVVFEIAREFVRENTRLLLYGHLARGGAEWTFRVRALMLESMAEVENDVLLFKGCDDSPFDEAIYSANHLLRAAGACKASAGVPALAPVLGSNSRLLVAQRRFDHVFSPRRDDSDIVWREHCICYRRRVLFEPRHPTYVLLDWKPTKAYPRARRWWSEYRRSGVLVGQGNLFDEVIRGRPDNMDYEEGRVTRREQRLLDRAERSLASESLGDRMAKELVSPDEIFRCEDGVRKAFRFFKPGEFLFHVHNGVEEKTPSAKTFSGGFHCFGCDHTYGVPRTRAWEETYPFVPDEILESDDADAFLPPLPWVDYLKKKYCVVSAPMGSGKTEQLVDLVNSLDENEDTVCVVSFRRFLAYQQSIRLGVHCYLDMTDVEIKESSWLTVCVNSLWKLGSHDFKYVILDECGLIRRHFLSTICVKILAKVYDRFVQLIREAKFVVMLQDGISREDVQFYTEIDQLQCDDRSVVSAVWFKKPIVIHPVQYTTRMFLALQNLITCYEQSFVDGVCRRPFMVFCSSLKFAEFLFDQLRGVALQLEGVDPDRVKCICGATKLVDEFSNAFAKNPNDVAAEADVVIATSVLGAGFSISCHFVAFHAFLFTDILNHTEENQFIRRLRFVMDRLPEGALRQSFLFVEKGHGRLVEYTSVLTDFRVVRHMLLQATLGGRPVPSVAVLEQTQARVVTERADTRAKHDLLWIEWGSKIRSNFQEMPGTDESDEAVSLKAIWLRWCRARKMDIGDLVQGDLDDVGATLSQLEVSSGIVMLRQAASDKKVTELKDAFKSTKVALALLKNMYPGVKDYTAFLGGPRLPKLIRRCRCLAVWLSWVYSALSKEQTLSPWRHLETKRYSRLSEHLVRDMLTGDDDGISRGYLISNGTTPFFTGASFVEDASLCDFFRIRLHDCTGDDEHMRDFKKELRSCVLLFTGNHNPCQTYLTELYENPNTALKFAKQMVKSIGLDVTSSDKRVRIDGERKRVQIVKTPEELLAMTFGLKFKFSNPLLELLPSLLGTQNLSRCDQNWVKQSVRLYNEQCSMFGEEEILINHADRVIGVIPDRVAEAIMERNIVPRGFSMDEEEEDGGTVVAARVMLDMQRELVDRHDEFFAIASHKRALARHNAIQEEEFSEDSEEDEGDNHHNAGGETSLYVVREAHEH